MAGGEPPIDVNSPAMARVHDYLLGGHDHFAADRELARQLERLHPRLRPAVRESREFVIRAVVWAARRGIAQFIDLGSGLPVPSSVHDAARGVLPAARVAYVDNDPMVSVHARVLLAADDDGLASVEADLADPAAVLADPALNAVISPAEPVCILLGLVLHFMAADLAREVVAGYARLVPPGSVIAVSVLRCDDEELSERTREAYTPAELHNHSREETAGFLGGLEVIPPGIVVGRAWRGGMPDPGLRPGGPLYVLAGAGLKG